MRGIAIVDWRPSEQTVAVWVTNRTRPLQALNTNAVVIDTANDPEGMEKVRSLTRCCIVMMTEDSSVDGLPIEGSVLRPADVAYLVTEIESQRVRILDAIGEYRARQRSTSLVEPIFAKIPVAKDFRPGHDTAGQRALAAANYVGKVWTEWLKTDDERRRRTVQPRSGKSPWIMPEDMNDQTVPDFPASFAERLNEQGLV